MKKILSLSFLLTAIVLQTSCKKDADITEAFGNKATTQQVSLATIKEGGEDIFDDNEPIEVVTSEDRFFYVNNPFNVSLKNGKLRIFNPLAHPFKNVTVYMEIPELGETIELLKLEEFPGLYISYIESPLKMGEVVYNSKENRPIKTNNLAMLTADKVNFTLECDDPVFQILKTIKMKTHIEMGVYGEGNWALMTPNAARYYANGAINIAAMFSTETFRRKILDYDGKFVDVNGKDIDREKFIETILNKPRLLFGVVKESDKIAGMGGGAVLGVQENYLTGLFYHNRVNLDSNWIMYIWMHELGHAIGYNHDSSICEGVFSNNMVPEVYRELMKKRQLPIIMNPFKVYNPYNPDKQS